MGEVKKLGTRFHIGNLVTGEVKIQEYEVGNRVLYKEKFYIIVEDLGIQQAIATYYHGFKLEEEK